MSDYIHLNGIKWYYRLKPKKDEKGKIKKGLFSDTPRNMLSNNLIVSVSYHDISNNKILLLYSHFKSYLEYGIYQLKLPHHERCFYEIVLGESNQKPHFDIDIDTDDNKNEDINGEDVKNNLIESIIKVLKDKDIKINLETDVLIYTSHGFKENISVGTDKDQGTPIKAKGHKQSYHIIINNYCHANNIEAKAFYHKVVDGMNPELAQWVDKSVYSPTQQFRIVGSRKIGSERVKIFQKVFRYYDREITHNYPEPAEDANHEFVMQLEESIIGYTGNCKFLPPFEPKPEDVKHYDSEVDDVTPKEAHEAISLIGLAGNISTHDSRFPYKFMGINGPIVMLKRIKPSNCKLCCRIHEHENPYLLVIGDERNVYFHCRRAPEGKSLFLGKLEPDQTSGSSSIHGEKFVDEKLDQIKVNWTKNVVEKVQQLARTGYANDKKYINSETNIDPNHKKQFIAMYINH